MSLKHTLLSKIYNPLQITNLALRQLGIFPNGRLRIANFHDIAAHEQADFVKQLRWLSQNWTFISPSKFKSIMLGMEPLQGSNLLLTFDDGFISNKKIADEVLNPMGIKALFFIIPAFADISDEVEARKFISQNIYPELEYENVPSGWYNMQWKELESLLDSGHTIGHHTLTHGRLSQIKDFSILEKEIISSASITERKLGINIKDFAFPFGNLSSFSPEALNLAKQRFQFVYTGLRGNNSANSANWAIRRDAIQPYDSLELVGALLEGAADLQYRSSITKYQNWFFYKNNVE